MLEDLSAIGGVLGSNLIPKRAGVLLFRGMVEGAETRRGRVVSRNKSNTAAVRSCIQYLDEVTVDQIGHHVFGIHRCSVWLDTEKTTF